MTLTFWDIFFAVVLALVVFTWLSSPSAPGGRDSTDAVDHRSGLTIYRDAATGVQYVGTILGGLAVRVDKDGKPYTDEVMK